MSVAAPLSPDGGAAHSGLHEFALWGTAAALVLSAHLLGAWAWERSNPEGETAEAAEVAMVIELAAPAAVPDLAQPAELAPPPSGFERAGAYPSGIVLPDSALPGSLPDSVPPDIAHDQAAPSDRPAPASPPSVSALVPPDVPPDAPDKVPPEPQAEPAQASAPVPAPTGVADSSIVAVRPPPRPERPAKARTASGAPASIPASTPAGAKPGVPPAEPTAERTAPREAVPQPAPVAAAPPTASDGASDGGAAVSGGPSTAPRIDPARWQGKVMAWLNRHKRYPAAARANREEGTAEVTFDIDPAGRVLGARISRSSGSATLDRAAVEMVTRASPVPAPPAEIARPALSLTVPVDFRIR